MEKNTNINDMLSSILQNNKDEFISAFKSEVEERIGSSIIDKGLSVSKSLLEPTPSDEEPIKEAKQKSSNYTFKNSSDAKKFVSAASTAGLNKKNFSIKRDVVSVSGIDKDMSRMLEMLAKEMKAKAH